MTIPIQSVNINPQFVPQQQAPGMELLLNALQHRQQLELAKKKFAQEQEQFELSKRLTTSTIAGNEIEQAARKQKMKNDQADLDARDHALAIVSGNLMRLRDTQAWGKILGEAPDNRTRGFINEYRDQFLGSEQKAASLAQTETTTQRTQLDMSEDRQIHGILDQFAGRPWTRSTISQAVGRVVAINPQKAGQVATALNSMLPDYQIHVNDDGTVGYIPKAPGPTVGGVQPKRPTDEQGKVGNYGVRVLEANATMTGLEQRYVGIGQRVDDKLRNVRTIEQIPGIGRAAATQALKLAVASMTPNEQKYFNSRTDLGNALLRRASGAQINMEELDRETSPYVPIVSEDESVVTSKQQRRLQQGLLFAQQAGSAFRPNSLTPEARRYLVNAVNPIQHPGYSPDNPYGAKKP